MREKIRKTPIVSNWGLHWVFILCCAYREALYMRVWMLHAKGKEQERSQCSFCASSSRSFIDLIEFEMHVWVWCVCVRIHWKENKQFFFLLLEMMREREEEYNLKNGSVSFTSIQVYNFVIFFYVCIILKIKQQLASQMWRIYILFISPPTIGLTCLQSRYTKKIKLLSYLARNTIYNILSTTSVYKIKTKKYYIACVVVV
jgi:hypothetical protein